MTVYSCRALNAARKAAGFTLLEIMIVVMIIGLLAGAAIHHLRKNVDIARDARVRGDIENIKTQLQIYEVRNGGYPSTQQGLQALVTRPTGDPQPRMWIQCMTDLPPDAWGTPYAYQYPAAKALNEAYDLFSAGKDKIAGTADDIGNW